MTSEKIYKTVESILIDIFDVSPDLVNSDLVFADLEVWDSLTQVRFIVALENEMELDFESEDLAKTKTVGELVILAHTKIK